MMIEKINERYGWWLNFITEELRNNFINQSLQYQSSNLAHVPIITGAMKE